MHGPEQRGHWTASRPGRAFKHLVPGHLYEVARDFIDYDGAFHKSGERWTYLDHTFLPYDDGLSLFVSLDVDNEWHIRLQWRPGQQSSVIDGLDGYIREVT